MPCGILAAMKLNFVSPTSMSSVSSDFSLTSKNCHEIVLRILRTMNILKICIIKVSQSRLESTYLRPLFTE